MATVNLGRIGFVNKGNWVASIAYKLNDIVTYSNKVYACTIAHTSTTTFDATKWILWVDSTVVGFGYALLNGDATQTFKVADGVATNDAVNFSQLGTKANLQGDNTKTFKVADAVNADEAVSKAQLDLKATLAEAQAYDIGVGQIWQDVTASRSADTTYTNTTGKPIQVSINSNDFSGGSYFYIDGVSVNYSSSTSAYGHEFQCNSIVPNGSTYKYSGTSIINWFELR